MGRLFAACLAAGGLSSCTGLPGWLDERIVDRPAGLVDPVAFPDLAQLPARPAPPSEVQRSAMVHELEAAQAANRQAADGLNRDIENDFEFPAPSGN